MIGDPVGLLNQGGSKMCEFCAIFEESKRESRPMTEAEAINYTAKLIDSVDIADSSWCGVCDNAPCSCEETD